MFNHEIVRSLIDYDEFTGMFFWKSRGDKKFDNKFADKPAINADKPAINADKGNGYKYGTILYKNVLAHRLAWFWMTGEWPEEVDHINGDRSDNRWSNLRIVDHSQNMKNSRLRLDNKSGCVGVGWETRRKVWRVTLFVDGKQKYGGSFKSYEEAVKRLEEFKIENGFHENHGH